MLPLRDLGWVRRLYREAPDGRAEILPSTARRAPRGGARRRAAVVCVKTGAHGLLQSRSDIVARDGVLTIQNGLGNSEMLAAAIGAARRRVRL